VHLSIIPTIILAGEIGVGKTTIMDLFPGETILELDDDLNEIIVKSINFTSLETIEECKIREIDLDELVNNSRLYNDLLKTAEIIIVVTNSAASNLGRTKQAISILLQKSPHADFYIIANFQDLKDSAFEPEKIEEFFNLKTFSFSAIQGDSKDEIIKILTYILKSSVSEKVDIESIRIDSEDITRQELKTFIKDQLDEKIEKLIKLPKGIKQKKYALIYRDLLKVYPKIQRSECRIGIAQIGVSENEDFFSEFYEKTGSGLLRLKEDKIEIVRSKVNAMIEKAQANNVNILVFPEMVIDLNHLQLLEEISNLAKSYEMYIIPGGYHNMETKENLSIVMGPEGILWEQKKHIPAMMRLKDGKRFKEGIETESFPRETIICNTEYGRIVIVICRDFLDMDLRVELKNFEYPVDIIFNPAFTPVTADFKAAHFDARRSIYAYCFFVNIAEFGESLVYTPEKERVERIIPPKEEDLIYKDINLFKLRSERKKWEVKKKEEKKFIQSTRE